MNQSGERYLAFPAWCRAHYGRRLYRVSLDAGMTCPNRDGTLGTRGCIFCDAGGSGDFAIAYHGQPIGEQDLIGHVPADIRGNAIAYFQAYTNTYAPVPVLRRLYECALQDDFFAGISIATRPDCLPQPVLDLLQELKTAWPQKFIWVELGLQSVKEESARWLRRGYELPVYSQAVQALHAREIPVIVHVIFGLPGESREDMLADIRFLNRDPVSGIKIQLLQILDHTDLAELWRQGSIPVLTQEEYVDIVSEALGWLHSDIAVHRLTGDGPAELLLAPLWSRNKHAVLNAIRHALKEKNIRQGCYLKGETHEQSS